MSIHEGEENIDPETGMPENPLFPKEKKEQQKFSMSWMKDPEGHMVLVLKFATGKTTPEGDEFFLYMIHEGENLDKFWTYIKNGMEQKSRRQGMIQ